ncbi:MAG: alkaline phosphatase family protein [bacterium]
MRQVLACKLAVSLALIAAVGGFCVSGCVNHVQMPASDVDYADGQRAETIAPKVVILVIDGLRYTESFGDPAREHIPHLSSELAPQGTLFDNFRNMGDTRTVPGHAAIVTGTWQYIENDGSERPGMPTVFEYYRKSRALAVEETAVVSGKSKLSVCSYSTHPDYGAAYGAVEDAGIGGDADVFNELIAVLAADHPSLVLVNFASVDGAGHSGEWDRYTDAIETADSLTAEVWEYLQADTVYAGHTYLFVTNDHGRHSDENGGFKDHGDGCEGCQHVMLLALGPEVRPGYTVTNFYTLRDLCPTIGELLGVETPESGGSVLNEMFIPSLTGIDAGSSR